MSPQGSQRMFRDKNEAMKYDKQATWDFRTRWNVEKRQNKRGQLEWQITHRLRWFAVGPRPRIDRWDGWMDGWESANSRCRLVFFRVASRTCTWMGLDLGVGLPCTYIRTCGGGAGPGAVGPGGTLSNWQYQAANEDQRRAFYCTTRGFPRDAQGSNSR